MARKDAVHYDKWVADDAHFPPAEKLQNMVVVITGASTREGIAYGTALAFATRGAKVIVAVRTTSKAEQNVVAPIMEEARKTGKGGAIEAMKLDLSSFASVRAFADEFKKKYTKVDVLLNNAAVMGMDVTMTEDNHDIQIQTNHLSHFLLTALLYPLFTPDAHVCTVASSLAEAGLPRIDFDGDFASPWFDRVYAKCIMNGQYARYGQSKACNVLFAKELQRRFTAKGLKMVSNTCHPGGSNTALQTTSAAHSDNWVSRVAARYRASYQHPDDGGLPSLRGCVEGPMGVDEWFAPKNYMSGEPVVSKCVAHFVDPTKQNSGSRLWEMSERICGVKFDV